MTELEKINRLIELKHQAKWILFEELIEKTMALKNHYHTEVERINRQIKKLQLLRGETS